MDSTYEYINEEGSKALGQRQPVSYQFPKHLDLEAVLGRGSGDHCLGRHDWLKERA